MTNRQAKSPVNQWYREMLAEHRVNGAAHLASAKAKLAQPTDSVKAVAPSGLPVRMTGYETARIIVRNNGAFVSVDVYQDAFDNNGNHRHFGGFDSTLEQGRSDADAFAAVAMTWFSKNAVHPGHWPTAWRHEVFGAVAGSEVAS